MSVDGLVLDLSLSSQGAANWSGERRCGAGRFSYRHASMHNACLPVHEDFRTCGANNGQDYGAGSRYSANCPHPCTAYKPKQDISKTRQAP